MSSHKAFTMKQAFVIEGGYLKSPLVLSTQTINGVMFVPLHPGTNRGLAKCLGADLKRRSPLKDCDVFAFLKAARDSKVDEIINL